MLVGPEVCLRLRSLARLHRIRQHNGWVDHLRATETAVELCRRSVVVLPAGVIAARTTLRAREHVGGPVDRAVLVLDLEHVTRSDERLEAGRHDRPYTGVMGAARHLERPAVGVLPVAVVCEVAT